MDRTVLAHRLVDIAGDLAALAEGKSVAAYETGASSPVKFAFSKVFRGEGVSDAQPRKRYRSGSDQAS